MHPVAQRSLTRLSGPPSWDKSESVALLAAVLAYCQTRMPPLDPKTFHTDDMPRVMPLIVWPANGFLRTLNDCTRRYRRMRTVWKTKCHQLHNSIQKFIEQHGVFPDPDPSSNTTPAATSSSNASQHGPQPSQGTKNTMNLTNMRVMPIGTGSIPATPARSNPPWTVLTESQFTAPISSAQSAATTTMASTQSRAVPAASVTRHNQSSAVVMPVPPAYIASDAPVMRRPDLIRHTTQPVPIDADAVFTWYDSKNKKHVRTASQNMSDHINLYEQYGLDHKTIHLFHAIAKLERHLKTVNQIVKDAQEEVQKCTDASLAVKSLLAAHSLLINVPNLQSKCDDLLVEKQKVLADAKTRLDRLYRRLDGLWVAVEEFTMGGRVCVHELHTAPFLVGFITEYSEPVVSSSMDVDPMVIPSQSPSLPIVAEEEVLPPEVMNEEVSVEAETAPMASDSIAQDLVYVVTPTRRLVVVDSEVPEWETLFPEVNDEDAQSHDAEVNVSGEMADPPTEPLQEQVVGDNLLNPMVVDQLMDDVAVTGESRKRMREYNVDEDQVMRPPSPKVLSDEPIPSTETEQDDNQFVDTLVKSRKLQDMPTYQLKMFAEKQDAENTLLVRVYQSFPSHSRITYSTTLSLDAFNTFVYLSVEDQKEVLSTRGRGRAVNGKYDKFDLVLAPATLKRYGRRGYITKYGNGFCIEPYDPQVNKT